MMAMIFQQPDETSNLALKRNQQLKKGNGEGRDRMNGKREPAHCGGLKGNDVTFRCVRLAFVVSVMEGVRGWI